MKHKILIVVDMQNDFIYGPLGTPEAQAIVLKVVDKIKNWRKGHIWYTRDLHIKDYLNTREGRHLPIEHCIQGTDGSMVQTDVAKALYNRGFLEPKNTFGSYNLPKEIFEFLFDHYKYIEEHWEFHLCGLCTDICVISNAIILQSYFPESEIYIDASCCAGTTPENHKKALDIMRGLGMNIINDTDN